MDQAVVSNVILGCGDVGRRIVKELQSQGHASSDIIGFVNSLESSQRCAELGVIALRFDLDNLERELSVCSGADLYYTVAPQKDGIQDKRSKFLLEHFDAAEILPAKVVLISTTGVYGDCEGEWVSEQSPINPQTDRGRRRLDAQQQWLSWGQRNSVPVVVLRVPAIYANSRLPRERIAKKIPVVRAVECGFTNRVHADDLASVCVVAMQGADAGEIFNVTDGTPGKISEYLQEAARVLELPPLPEISMSEAETTLSSGMLSYLGESRKISNEKMLEVLSVELKYPDFRQGIKY